MDMRWGGFQVDIDVEQFANSMQMDVKGKKREKLQNVPAAVEIFMGDNYSH